MVMLSFIRVLTKWVRQVNYPSAPGFDLISTFHEIKKITEEGGMQKEDDDKTWFILSFCLLLAWKATA